jgi:hypothetical protein
VNSVEDWNWTGERVLSFFIKNNNPNLRMYPNETNLEHSDEFVY